MSNDHRSFLDYDPAGRIIFCERIFRPGRKSRRSKRHLILDAITIPCALGLITVGLLMLWAFA